MSKLEHVFTIKLVSRQTSISASSRYPTVNLVMSTRNGSSMGISFDEGSSGSLPRTISRTTAQSVADLQKGPSLS